MSTITFTGNIGKSKGLKFSNDGKPRLSFSAAETARVKDQSGQYVDGGTTWFNVTLFGYTAEALDAQIAAQGGKGKVIVTGRMSTREYEHNGEKRESLDVVADSVGLVPRSQQQGSGQQQPAQQNAWSAAPQQAPANPAWAQGEAPF
jgi:single-strand DNA-binding protein